MLMRAYARLGSSTSLLLISCWGMTVKTALLVGRRTQDTRKPTGTKQPWPLKNEARNGAIRGYSTANEKGHWPFVIFFFLRRLNLNLGSLPFISRWVLYRKCSLILPWLCGHAAAEASWAMKSADRCEAIHHFSRFTRGSRAEIGSPFVPVKQELEPLGFILVWSQCAQISSKSHSVWDIWDSIESTAVTITV